MRQIVNATQSTASHPRCMSVFPLAVRRQFGYANASQSVDFTVQMKVSEWATAITRVLSQKQFLAKAADVAGPMPATFPRSLLHKRQLVRLRRQQASRPAVNVRAPTSVYGDSNNILTTQKSSRAQQVSRALQ